MSKPTIKEMVDAIDQEIKNHQRFIGHEKHTGRLRSTKAALLKLGEWKQMVNNSRGVEESVALKLVYEIRDFGEEGK